MEALNAAGLIPLSVLCDRRTEPGKLSSLPPISALKNQKFSSFSTTQPSLQECLSRGLGGLSVLASVINAGVAKALTYEEALQKYVTAPSAADSDATGIIDNIISYGTENPTIIAGGVAILAVPLVLSQVLKKPKPWGIESVKNAYAKLGDDANTRLLDIRAPVDFRQVGSPDIRALSKKPVSIVYKGDDKPGFLKKLSSKFNEPENTTLFILDKFDGNSELVAELVTINGFKAAYAVKDGAEGPRGWMNSGLPWIPPRKALSLDLGNLADAVAGALGGSGGLPVTLGIAAATGLGLLAFSEIETILQLLGSAALVQFASKKLLFAEDRKETLKQVDEFLNTKVAPKELVDEIKQIGKALLPSTATSNALPAPTEKNLEPATIPETAAQSKVEAAPAPEIISVPKTDVKAESLPGLPKPLSPYPIYADLRPPTSPTPSQPLELYMNYDYRVEFHNWQLFLLGISRVLLRYSICVLVT
ncbi:rhodanese-like domain-containing protein 4, chloroplastic [Quillaja saponaria]|uniref:Rhodanese-like domain-containing protein 4, chloroplastic n=1 Tax=Quillaja saponaria TaxID=32244 RepID=A0AAD7PD80_QUISA|nr:rhodanese-like domain-containing protein 4, chloroplastic [Quillaja saponaria]